MVSTWCPNMKSPKQLKTRWIRPTCRNKALNIRQYSPAIINGVNKAPKSISTSGFVEPPAASAASQIKALMLNIIHVMYGCLMDSGNGIPELNVCSSRRSFMILITAQCYVTVRHMAIFQIVTDLSFERRHFAIHTP